MGEIPSVEDVARILLAEMPDLEDTQKEKFSRVKSLKVLMKEPDTDSPYLWGDVFPKGEYVGVVGKSGVNKSTFCRQLCISIATKQQEFLGAKLTPHYGKTLYCYSEESEGWIRRYMRKQLIGLQYDEHALDDMDVVNLNEFDTGNEFLEFFDEFLQERTYDLIVIDSYSDFIVKFDAKLNDNDSIRKLKKQIDFLKKGGCTVLFNHHTSDKANAVGTFLGANAFRQIARAQLEIFADGNDRILSSEKVQYGFSFEPIVCNLSEDFLFIPTGRTMSRSELYNLVTTGNFASASPVSPNRIANCNTQTVGSIFGEKTTMTSGDIKVAFNVKYQATERTAERWISGAVNAGLIAKTERGVYTILMTEATDNLPDIRHDNGTVGNDVGSAVGNSATDLWGDAVPAFDFPKEEFETPEYTINEHYGD